MPYTQADADRLRAAIAKGASKIELNGERIEFRSLADMRETLNMIEGELAGGEKAFFRISYPRAGRGL